MSRHYKAITNHVPMDFGQELDQIETYFRGLHEAFVSLFERWTHRPLEFDEVGPLIAQLQRRLVGFALDCNALPLRTPQQLMATVRVIAKDPRPSWPVSGNMIPRRWRGSMGLMPAIPMRDGRSWRISSGARALRRLSRRSSWRRRGFWLTWKPNSGRPRTGVARHSFCRTN